MKTELVKTSENEWINAIYKAEENKSFVYMQNSLKNIAYLIWFRLKE